MQMHGETCLSCLQLYMFGVGKQQQQQQQPQPRKHNNFGWRHCSHFWPVFGGNDPAHCQKNAVRALRGLKKQVQTVNWQIESKSVYATFVWYWATCGSKAYPYKRTAGSKAYPYKRTAAPRLTHTSVPRGGLSVRL